MKLKKATWDKMEEHTRAINGLKHTWIVYNYQIRKVSTQDKRRLRLITELRKNQIKEALKKKKMERK